MAVLYATLRISNPLREDVEPQWIRCLVNRSLYKHLIIREGIAKKLELKEVCKREEKIGNGPTEVFSYVGPIKLEFEGRIGYMGALVIKNDDYNTCYLGSIAMNEVGLTVLETPTFVGLGHDPNVIVF